MASNFSDLFGYDLEGVIIYSGALPFTLTDVQEIVAFYEGEPEGKDYCWILKTTEGYIGVEASSAYSGWDVGTFTRHSDYKDTPQDVLPFFSNFYVATVLEEQVEAKKAAASWWLMKRTEFNEPFVDKVEPQE